MDPDPKGADSLTVSSCLPQLEFDAATNRRILLPACLQVTYNKGENQSDDVVDDSENDHEKFLLGYNKTRKEVYINLYRVVMNEN